MPIYIVITEAQTTIRERWAVQAADMDEAEEKVFTGEAVFMDEENIGEERGRETYGVELAGTREAEVCAILAANMELVEEEGE